MCEREKNTCCLFVKYKVHQYKNRLSNDICGTALQNQWCCGKFPLGHCHKKLISEMGHSIISMDYVLPAYQQRCNYNTYQLPIPCYFTLNVHIQGLKSTH